MTARQARFEGVLSLAKRRRPIIGGGFSADRPQIVAHRGSSSLVAEHTLAAYLRALEEGAEALECDVRLTADGHLVCVHDRRIDRTSNGRGVVSTLPLKELQALDWSSWKQRVAQSGPPVLTEPPVLAEPPTLGEPPPLGEETSLSDEGATFFRTPDTSVDQPGGSHDGRDLDRTTVLTLERLFDAVHDWGRPVDLAIETKHPTRYAGLVEQRLIELLDRYGWARPKRGHLSPARVMSFSWLSLRRSLEMAPALEMVYLMDRVPLWLRDGSLPLGVGVSGPSIEIIRAHPEYVDKVHAAGKQVHVWTVNDPRDLAMCADLGVDAIITDRPGEALKQLGDSGN